MLVARTETYELKGSYRGYSAFAERKRTALSRGLLYIASLAVIVLISLSLVWYYAALSAMDTRINKLNNAISDYEEKNADLQIELSAMLAPARIDTMARNMGMVDPGREQIRLVVLDKDELAQDK